MKKNQHPLYSTWANMKQRCYNENRPGYEYYGGRGIYVCERWLKSFDAFASDMGGSKPSSRHSLDRSTMTGHTAPITAGGPHRKSKGRT